MIEEPWMALLAIALLALVMPVVSYAILLAGDVIGLRMEERFR